MKGLEELLGFRITGNPNSCIDHRRIEILSADGDSVKAVRPATHQEIDLWQALVGTEVGMQQAAGTLREALDTNAQLLADNRSLKASCDAYREQLQKLHDFLAHKYPIQPTDDCIEYAMDRLVGLEHRKNELRKRILEIWQMPPGVDVFDFMLERLKDVTGENMEATEKRRADTIKERAERFPGDPMNSMLADELDKVHARIAGKKVQE